MTKKEANRESESYGLVVCHRQNHLSHPETETTAAELKQKCHCLSAR